MSRRAAVLEMNTKMTTKIGYFRRQVTQLPAELGEILAAGFCDRDGCTFLKALSGQGGNASLADFPDKTGFECYINSIHVDDYVDDHTIDYACLFVESLLAKWRQRGENETAVAIISSDDAGAVVKFHVVRSGEAWLHNELESYDEAILVADSRERYVSRRVH